MAKSTKAGKNVIFENETSRSSESEEFSESKPSTVENIISVVLGLAVVFVIGAMIVNVIRNRNSQPEPETEQAQDQTTATISAMYTVQAGDTLWSIAEKHYSDGFKYPEIQKANNMTEQSSLEKGMQLIIPKIEGVVAVATPSPVPSQGPSGTSTAPVSPTKTVPTETIVPSPTTVPSSTATPSTATISQGPTGPTGSMPSGTTPPGETSSASTDRQYTVVKGDSLWAISVKRYNNGYRWVEIARMNNLKNPGIIHAGNVLLMP